MAKNNMIKESKEEMICAEKMLAMMNLNVVIEFDQEEKNVNIRGSLSDM